MARITRQEYIKLRKQGLTQEQITELVEKSQKPGVDEFLETASKVTDTIFGSGKVGEAIGTQIAKGTFGPKIRELVTGVNLPTGAEEFVSKGPKVGEVVGSVARSGALFIPQAKVAKGITGAFKAASTVPRLAQAIGKVGAGAGTGFAFDVASGLEAGETIPEAIKPGVGTAIGAAIPAAGELFGLGKRLIGGALKGTGEGIQKTVIKPNARDLSDGFKVENVQKYKVGGSLQQMLNKTDDKIDDLSQQLSAKIQKADDVDLSKVFKEVSDELTTDKARAFGSIGRLESQLGKLQDEITAVSSGTGVVPAPVAQQVKRSSGLLGAWRFGAPDPDSNAQEIIYTTFYRKLREALEKAGGKDIQSINKQISELIPIQHAVIRRIPVAQRNQALGLGDIITLSASTVEPSALLLTVGNRAAKSGRVGEFLTDVGERLLKEGVPQTTISRVIQAAERAILSGITNQPEK